MKRVMLFLAMLSVFSLLTGCRVPVSNEPTEPSQSPTAAQLTPDPPREELEDLEERLNTTDLKIEIEARPDPVGINERLSYIITVTNDGPNPASEVQLTDHLPEGVAVVSSPMECREEPPRTLTCDLGELLARQESTIEVEVSVQDSAPLTLRNVTEVINLAGPDPNPQNNTVTIEVQRR